MSLNTIEENRRLNLFEEGEEVWLFGYGSLIYKVDFPFLESKPASIDGWSRKFWQGSHDHRGTEQNPGRVATLVEDDTATCGGLAFKVESAVFSHLDEREKNGYLRILTDLTFKDGSIDKGVVYIASPDNEAYLGEASETDIAKQICQAKGPSGPNCEYLLELAKALRELELEDEHVFEIERCVEKIKGIS